MNLDFIAARMDYVHFLHGTALVVLAAFVSALRRNRRATLPWRWLVAFGWIHGIREWLEMLVPATGDTTALHAVRALLLLMSLVALFEFGRSGCQAAFGLNTCTPAVYIPALLLTAAGALAGLDGLAAAARYALGLPATLLITLALARGAQRGSSSAWAFRMAALCAAINGLLEAIFPSPAPFHPASVLNTESFLAFTGVPIEALRALAVTGWAAAIWKLVLATSYKPDAPTRILMPLRIRSTAIGLLAIAAAVGAAAEYLGRAAPAMGTAVDLHSPEVHRLAGLGAGALMILLMVDFFSRQHRLWVGAVRLAESEADYRLLSEELERRVSQRTDQLAAANRALRHEIERTRAAELKYRSLTDQLPAITYTVQLGARSTTTFISPQVESLLGYTPEEWIANPALWLSRVHAEDRERVRQVIAQCDASGEPLDVEFRALTRQGQPRSFRALHRYVRDAQGRPSTAHGVMLDITDRVETAQALRETGERYRLLFAHSPVGVFHFDRDLRLTDTNERFVNILRSRREKLLGVNLNTLLDPSILPTLRAALSGGEGYHEGPYAASPGDAELWISLRTAPVYGDDRQITGGVAIVEDLTERRRLEDEHLRTQKLESLGLLAGGLAHDFNNILTAVLGNISMLRGDEPRTPAETGEILQDAERAALRARDLTQQLLTFAKGGAPLKRLVSVADLVREAASFTVRGSASKCVYRLPADTWPAEVDSGQITQVVQNLVINADQAMPDGGVITLEADNVRLTAGEVGHLPAGPYVRIRVADTGVGIPERYMGRIFDPYFTTKQKGSGLGLTMCFSIVQKHGGHITVASKVGQGTTFSIYLPALTDTAAEARGLDAAEPDPCPGGRILMMDDEVTILGFARRMLESAGYEVETAPDGEEAIRLFTVAQRAGRPFDVVILDLTVPGGLGGKETFQRLRKLQPDVCAIVSSGYSTDQIMAQFRTLGFAGVVPKPYTSKELLKALRQARQHDAPSQA